MNPSVINILKHYRNNRGFLLGYIMLISALVMIIITAVTFLTQSRHSATRDIFYSEQAHYLADSGIQHALSQLRQNSIKFDGLADIDVTTKSDKSYIENSYHVDLSTQSALEISEDLVVSATSYGIVRNTINNKETVKKIHVIVQVNSLSDYFEISTKTLKIGRGLDISNADIYGYNIVFLSDGSTDPTKVRKADYYNNAQNDTQSWVEIGGIAGIGASKLPLKIDLPIIDELIPTYEKLAGTTNYANNKVPPHSNNSGILGDTYCTNGYNTSISGDIYPPKNGNGVYYSNQEIIIGDPFLITTIYGSMIFVTSEAITIKGNIKKSTWDHTDTDGDNHYDHFDSWTDPDYAVAFTSTPVMASLVGLFSGSNVYVEKTDAAGQAQTVDIEAVIMASNGSFSARPAVKLNSSAALDFTGSIMIRDGILLSQIYTDPLKRTYKYDTDLEEYELPHMPYIANILYSRTW